MPAYSPAPLIRKLGIRPGLTIALINDPGHFSDLLGPLPAGVVIRRRLVQDSLDYIHLFVTKSSELTSSAKRCKSARRKSGMLWISWPKGASGVNTDLSRDSIREYLLAIGLVDVKVASVDETWSGLKFVYRLKDR